VRHLAILGSTGSIGTQTLEVVENNEDMKVVALAAGSSMYLPGGEGERAGTQSSRRECFRAVWHGWTDRLCNSGIG